MKLFDEDGIELPGIDQLAEHGLVFENAFSNAPVCSVARTTLITGSYAPRIMAQFHRPIEKVPMPDGLMMFPHYLKKAGYYTTNNSKKDYNTEEVDVWDESSNQATYRDRKAGQPFFHVQNFGESHESRLHFSEEQMQARKTSVDPDDVQSYPYHPDTPLFRYTKAWYFERHKVIEEQIAAFIDQLRVDGLLEETIIFYFGDHGGVLPGSKGYIYERGLNVPLIVHIPEKWEHLTAFKPGSRVGSFVSFVDFGPTVLNLAGVPVPEQMNGKPFLGEGVDADEVAQRETSYGYGDRFDEKSDLVRSIRVGDYKYIRNFQPYLHDGLYNDYRYIMLAYQEWRELYDLGKLNAVQSQFFEPKPVEALFDISADPHETQNLADDPAYRETLETLRDQLTDFLKSLPDLSFYGEHLLLENAISNPVAFGQSNRKQIAELIDTANLVLQPFKKVKCDITDALNDKEEAMRYWGVNHCLYFGKDAKSLSRELKKIRKKDKSPLLRVMAAAYFARLGEKYESDEFQKALDDSRNQGEALLIMNYIQWLNETVDSFEISLDSSNLPEEWLKNNRDRPTDLQKRLLQL